MSFILRARDPDGDRVSFWSDPLPEGAQLDASGRFRWTPTFDQAGRYELLLHASDNVAGHTATTRVIITVTDVTVATRIDQTV